MLSLIEDTYPSRRLLTSEYGDYSVHESISLD